MEIKVTREQELALNELLATGRIGSAEDVISFALDQLRADTDDVLWAKPFVDEAIAELDRGEGEDWDPAAFLGRMRSQHGSRR